MKNKSILYTLIAAVLVAVVIVITVIALTSQSNEPEDAINNMVTALNNLDFDAYVDTLHPALQADAKKGMTQENKFSYMHSLRSELIGDYPEGTNIYITHYENYQLESNDIIAIKNQYKELGYDIEIQDAKIYYYYSVLLPNGNPDGLDEITVVKCNGMWYLLA